MDAELPRGRRHTREDSGIRLDRHGRWWHDGEPVEHPRIVRAFDRGLAPTEDGRFKLHFGWDWCFVEVEGPAYRVVAVQPGGRELRIELSDESREVLLSESLRLDGDGSLLCTVKQGRAQARFSRDAQFALGELLEERDGVVGLALEGGFRPLPPAALEG